MIISSNPCQGEGVAREPRHHPAGVKLPDDAHQLLLSVFGGRFSFPKKNSAVRLKEG